MRGRNGRDRHAPFPASAGRAKAMTGTNPGAWQDAMPALLTTGRLDEACDLLDRHLRVHHADADAWRQLARIELARRNTAPALRALRRAAALTPTAAGLDYELGVALLADGDVAAAVDCFRRQIDAQPDHADALYNLGWALQRTGRPGPAAEALRRAVRLRPSWAVAWFNLGNALMDDRRPAEAEHAYAAALEQAPTAPDVLSNLGWACWLQGKTPQAEDHLRRVLTLVPDHPQASANLGSVLMATGRAAQAADLCRGTLARHPDSVEVLLVLALALRQGGGKAEALTHASRAVELAPHRADSWNILGSCLLALDLPDQAESAFRQALERDATLVEAMNNLGNAAASRGDAAAALDWYRKAHALAPENAAIHSNLLFLMIHGGDTDRAEAIAEHKRYGRIQEALVAPLVLPAPADAPGRKLRVGYVSPDFCEHSVTYWFEGVLARHDTQRFEIFCYHCGPRTDHVTRRLQEYGHHWRSIAGLPWDVAAATIAADDIDLLVDLAGHSAHNALPVFARKPARIQAAWLGYPFTTGLTRIDWRLTQIDADPPGMNDANYTETLAPIGLSPVFRPPADAPLTPPPLLRLGRPRFGSFNKPQKVTPPVLDTWARLLTAVPDASLLIVAPAGDEPPTRDRYRHLFARRGIDPTRVDTAPTCPIDDFMALIGQVDVALDPFPYGGGTTTMLTLWMGVPIVCLNDSCSAAAAVTQGTLGMLGLGHLCAADPDDYVRIAADLAQDADTLQDLRRDLRQRMVRDYIQQEAQFVAQVEQEYFRWWRLWLEGRQNQPAGPRT